jgi:hypothetical protein
MLNLVFRNAESRLQTLHGRLTLLLLLFFEIFIKLNRFFMLLPLRLASLFPLFTLLLVSGRCRWLGERPRLFWLILEWLTWLGAENAGKASGAGELGVAGVVWRKLRLSRLRPTSLPGLCVDVATEEASLSSTDCLSTLSSSSFSESPISTPLVRKARLNLFLSCRDGLPFGAGDATLTPFMWWSSGNGLVMWERLVAAAIHEPVGERIAGAMLSGVKVAISL